MNLLYKEKISVQKLYSTANQNNSVIKSHLNAKPLYCEGKLGDYLQSSASIEEQIEILVASVCPESTDPVRCEEAARMYWSEIGKSK